VHRKSVLVCHHDLSNEPDTIEGYLVPILRAGIIRILNPQHQKCLPWRRQEGGPKSRRHARESCDASGIDTRGSSYSGRMATWLCRRLVGSWPLPGTRTTQNTFLLAALFMDAWFVIQSGVAHFLKICRDRYRVLTVSAPMRGSRRGTPQTDDLDLTFNLVLTVAAATALRGGTSMCSHRIPRLPRRAGII
jgi:hypothetical protein